jgi:hypothetical protein
MVVACQDCDGPDRLGCLEGKVASCPEHMDNINEIHKEMRKQVSAIKMPRSHPVKKDPTYHLVFAQDGNGKDTDMIVVIVLVIIIAAFIYANKK